jgi:hypothetical protein
MMQLHDDELDQEKRPNQDALLQQLAGPPMLPGGTATGPDPIPQETGMGMTQPSQKPQSYDYLGGGYNRDKLNDPNKQSAKYIMGRTFAGFDPRQGITPEVLAALNGLGFGSFSGAGDKLSLAGLTDKGRQHGLVGDYEKGDFIEGLKSGNGKWSYADPADEARLAQQGGQGGGQGGGMGLGIAQGGLHSLLSGDPMAGIQAAIGQYAGQGDNLKALLAQLQGGR